MDIKNSYDTFIENFKNKYANFIEDMSGRSRTLNNIKRKYGLVPSKNEEFTAFEKRVYETVFRKSNPRNNLLIRSQTNLTENTAEMQEILSRFLGFEEVPLDSYEKPDDNSPIGGFTIEENDGSALVVTKDKPAIFKDFTIHQLKNDLESIVLGRHIDYNMAGSGFWRAYKSANFNANDPVHKTYARVYDSLLDVEEFIKLHEGIHAVHINNLNGKRNGGENNYLKKALIMTIPVIGPLYKFFAFSNVIESEILAYKVGLDIYTDHLLSEVQNYSRRNPQMSAALEQVKDEFKSLNTKMSKGIIRTGYLNAPIKGYGKPSISAVKASVYGYFAYSNIQSDSVWLIGLGAMLGTFAANNAIKSAASAYLGWKINHDVNKVESLIEKYRGPKEFFQEVLGKRIGEME